MRLLEYNGGGSLRLLEFASGEAPPYAILSHTWGEDEVTFQDLMEDERKEKITIKQGYGKLLSFAKQAERDGLKYLWADTCCIDKLNMSELNEAVNSMFAWYKSASRCYVHLSDVESRLVEHGLDSWEVMFPESRWFTRSWTLQELLAPSSVEFFSARWRRLGSKISLEQSICDATGIPKEALQGTPLASFSTSERIAWSKRRTATRVEDQTYALCGIFGVRMSIMYGEGRSAARNRLYMEITKQSRAGTSTATETAQDPTNLTLRPQRNDTSNNPSHALEPFDEIREPPAVQQTPLCSFCNVLLGLWIFIAILSLTIGLWRSFTTGDEGKGFTDAAYVVGVGSIIILPIQNRHAPRCKRK